MPLSYADLSALAARGISVEDEEAPIDEEERNLLFPRGLPDEAHRGGLAQLAAQSMQSPTPATEPLVTPDQPAPQPDQSVLPKERGRMLFTNDPAAFARSEAQRQEQQAVGGIVNFVGDVVKMAAGGYGAAAGAAGAGAGAAGGGAAGGGAAAGGEAAVGAGGATGGAAGGGTGGGGAGGIMDMFGGKGGGQAGGGMGGMMQFGPKNKEIVRQLEEYDKKVALARLGGGLTPGQDYWAQGA